MYKTRGNTCHFHGSKLFEQIAEGLLKDLEKVLLESSRESANLTVPSECSDEESECSDEESDKGKYVCILHYKLKCVILKQKFR